jgi:hypothetical protein
VTATAFDTLKAARDLEAAGIDSRQAEAIVSTIRQSGDAVATKSDLEAVRIAMSADVEAARIAMRADLDTARSAMRADLAELKSDMLKVAIGIVIANVGLTVTLIKLL